MQSLKCMYAPARLPIHLSLSMVLSLMHCKINGCSTKIGHRFPCILIKKKRDVAPPWGVGIGPSAQLGPPKRPCQQATPKFYNILYFMNIQSRGHQTASKWSKTFLFLHTAPLCTFIQKPTLQGVTDPTMQDTTKFQLCKYKQSTFIYRPEIKN